MDRRFNALFLHAAYLQPLLWRCALPPGEPDARRRSPQAVQVHMTDDLPITPPPRPADPMTALDGARLLTMITAVEARLNGSIGELSNRLASLQRQMIEMSNLVRLIEADTSNTRIKRLELEIEEAEQEKQAAENRLRIAEERLAKKQTIKDENVDTGERLKAVAAAAISDAERQRKETDAAFLIDLKRSILKAVLISLSVSAVGGLIAFFWFLAQLYLNR